MDEQVGEFLRQQIYSDLKIWVPNLYRRLKAPLSKFKAPTYSSPSELLGALNNNKIKPDSWVTLECKPSMFGPFLRNHFITPFIGHHSNMRLGPSLVSENPVVAVFGQVTSHLKPVGLYPAIDDDLYQVSLYPSDANVCGMIGLAPGISKLVEHLPAVFNGENLTFCGTNCKVRGVIRHVDPKLLTDIGVPIEKYEELRQSGDIWFLDASAAETEVEPRSNATTEMWAGLYASGHMEILEGELKVDPLVAGMAEAFRDVGFEPHVTQNLAKGREVTVYAQGIRAVIGTLSPIYSIHMDAEIALQYKENRQKFDKVCNSYLDKIIQVANDCSVGIANPNDLDFSYTDSDESYSVLKSLGSNHIADPVAMAIRDWHRKRGK